MAMVETKNHIKDQVVLALGIEKGYLATGSEDLLKNDYATQSQRLVERSHIAFASPELYKK
jgi:hypothetical protein